MIARLRRNEGFGLVELLIAMTVLSVGILAIIAGFSSGYVAINHAQRVSSASAIADQQMEKFRATTYNNIASASATYTSTSSPASPDGRQYTMTATVTTQTAPGTTSRQYKLVTVSVSDSTGQLVSEQSTFDKLSGCVGTATAGSATACSS